SNWTSTGTLLVRNGQFSVLNGGAASFGSAQIGTIAQGADALVSGAGSIFSTTGDLVVGSTTGNGALTVVDGGQLIAGGLLTIAEDAGTSGRVTVGDGGLLRVDGAALAMGLGDAMLNIGGSGLTPGTASAGTLDA